jgi:hypothetical protein
MLAKCMFAKMRFTKTHFCKNAPSQVALGLHFREKYDPEYGVFPNMQNARNRKCKMQEIGNAKCKLSEMQFFAPD